MSKLSSLLEAACRASGLDLATLARLANVDPTKLHDGRLNASEIDLCARVFGVRLEDFLDGKATHAALGLLIRSRLEGGPAGLQDALSTEIHVALGEFLRVVRDIAELEGLLGIVAPPPPRIPLLESRPDEHAGERAARTVRHYLRLGLEPIRSVRAVVEQELSVRIVWVTEDQVDRSLDGACTVEPRSAIMVNLLESQRSPWRTRITLAHELCHVLFDQDVQGRRALVSPHGKTPALFDGFADIETRARAFAACFLAPADGVRDAIDGEDPTSEAAIRSVGERFGVGRTVAINRLGHVFKLGPDARQRMNARIGDSYQGDFDGDQVEEPLGFRGGVVRQLVGEAIAKGKISGVRGRRMLGLTPADTLPFEELPEEVRAPLISRAEIMRRRGDEILSERWQDAGLAARDARPEGTSWRIGVVSTRDGPRTPQPRGSLLLTATGDLEAEEVKGMLS